MGGVDILQVLGSNSTSVLFDVSFVRCQVEMAVDYTCAEGLFDAVF